MSAATEHLDYHLGNAFAAHGVSGAALLVAVAGARAALLPLLGDGASHDEVASSAYSYALTHAPAAAAVPPATKPTVVSEQAFRARFGDAALNFDATDRLALTRTLEREIGIKPPTVADRQKIAPVTREQLQAHFGTATNLDDLPARTKLAACNAITAARSKAAAA